MPNSLTRRVSLTIGPLFLETLVKHYFARVIRDSSKSSVPLRSEELLYDEAFNIVKDFLSASTRHTVEELQSFSNVRTPSPPWVHVVRLIIPMSSCDEAAVYLIKAFRGEEVMKRVVGGTKWWQVRGVRGLDAEWITAKKHWQDAQRRAKEESAPGNARQSGPAEGHGLRDTSLEDVTSTTVPESESEENHELPPGPSNTEPSRDSASYQPEMDDLRCILYSHGGGYYFGSVDQERYSIQRFARKIRGRVLAVNYRLAPQYPFPCALQDLLAAYLFLIKPPEGAAHRPVRPERIVVAGDSAGGGLSLALLQVIRDSGLPAPAGGVLISPWCDFTHSFPSIFTNTETDVIPATGLSLHKPSPLWPPPPNEIRNRVHSGLRKNISDVLHRRSKSRTSRTPQAAPPIDPDNVVPKILPTELGPMNVESTASLPLPGVLDADQTISLHTADGTNIEITQQIQLYAPNGLLKHPLVSPALSYLGGLPPLLFIAGEREVLRDEIIYTAHRAAYPERFPVSDATKEMYPVFKHGESYKQPTSVHLQVYDDVAHVLPILFPFTTPGKYCYRAMALFVKHVTTAPRGPFRPNAVLIPSGVTLTTDPGFSASPSQLTPTTEVQSPHLPRPKPRRSLTSGLSRAVSHLKRRASSSAVQKPRGIVATLGDSSASTLSYLTPKSPNQSDESVGVAGQRKDGRSETDSGGISVAGEAKVYAYDWARYGHQSMIRERVSTRGVIRPLEPETELPAMKVPSELIGTLSEVAIRRYATGKERFDKKFARTIKRIEKHRLRNINRASQDMNRHVAALQHYLDRESMAAVPGAADRRTAALSAPSSWNMAWALDEDERPPPSSIVARRDTAEALKLARVADEAVLASEHTLSANNLWSVIISFLMDTPEERRKKREARRHSRIARAKAEAHVVVVGAQRKTRVGTFLGRKRRSEPSSGSGNKESSNDD